MYDIFLSPLGISGRHPAPCSGAHGVSPTPWRQHVLQHGLILVQVQRPKPSVAAHSLQYSQGSARWQPPCLARPGRPTAAGSSEGFRGCSLDQPAEAALSSSCAAKTFSKASRGHRGHWLLTASQGTKGNHIPSGSIYNPLTKSNPDPKAMPNFMHVSSKNSYFQLHSFIPVSCWGWNPVPCAFQAPFSF